MGGVYSAGTIRYDTSTYAVPAAPSLVSLISGSQSLEEGVRVASVSKDEFVVTGWTAIPLPKDFMTFRVHELLPNTPIWLATQDASGGVDQATAIIAPNGSAGPVYVAGYGYRPGTGRDFMVIRYDGP